MTARSELEARTLALIAEPALRNDLARDALIDDLAAWQRSRIPEYARLGPAGSWPAAMPTEAFRRRRLAAHPPEADARLFLSSGTTAAERSMHALDDLRLYDAAARSAARHMLFFDVDRMPLVVLAPHAREAPQSSLSYMLTRFDDWFAERTAWVWRNEGLDLEALRHALEDAETTGTPIALLGTSFAFVHAEDGLGAMQFQLPEGSRIMQTGGYKGKSREIDPPALRRDMSDRYGIAESHIVAEYGMTELSSQLYETTLRDRLCGTTGPRRLWIPPWVRATPVDADTLAPVEGDAVGVVRIDDCANVGSLCCIQTADLGRRVDNGLRLEGRLPGAAARGCSLAVDLALTEQSDDRHA